MFTSVVGEDQVGRWVGGGESSGLYLKKRRGQGKRGSKKSRWKIPSTSKVPTTRSVGS